MKIILNGACGKMGKVILAAMEKDADITLAAAIDPGFTEMDATHLAAFPKEKIDADGHAEKDDFVVLTDEAWLPIEQYLQERGECKPDEPLFATNGFGHNGGRMSTRSIQDICKKNLRAIGLDGHEYSAHSLRHTTGTQILKNGGSMMDVQQVLRHTSPSTSQLYVNTIMEEKRLDDASEQILDGSFKK